MHVKTEMAINDKKEPKSAVLFTCICNTYDQITSIRKKHKGTKEIKGITRSQTKL